MSTARGVCPFCRSTRSQLVNMNESVRGEERHGWRVECVDCGALGPNGATTRDAERHWRHAGAVWQEGQGD